MALNSPSPQPSPGGRGKRRPFTEEISGEELLSFRREWQDRFDMARRVLRERPEIVRKHIKALASTGLVPVVPKTGN